MKTIELSRGEVALIDDEDFDRVSKYKWCLHHWNGRPHNKYAHRAKGEKLHRFILQCAPGQIVDHINGNGLDNRRYNLRIVDYSQNAMNRKKRSDCSSGIPGINFHNGTKKWIVRIQVRGKRFNIGRFINKDEAILARSEAMKKHFGEFCRSIEA